MRPRPAEPGRGPRREAGVPSFPTLTPRTRHPDRHPHWGWEAGLVVATAATYFSPVDGSSMCPPSGPLCEEAGDSFLAGMRSPGRLRPQGQTRSASSLAFRSGGPPRPLSICAGLLLPPSERPSRGAHRPAAARACPALTAPRSIGLSGEACPSAGSATAPASRAPPSSRAPGARPRDAAGQTACPQEGPRRRGGQPRERVAGPRVPEATKAQPT